MKFRSEITILTAFLIFVGFENPSCKQTHSPSKAGNSIDAIFANRTLLRNAEINKDTTKYIYFTIDDGPSFFSKDILEIARQESAKMTVFLEGINVNNEKFRQYLSDYKNDILIEVGNHSYSHASGKYKRFYSDPNAVLRDFYKNNLTLQLNSNIARLPGRPFWCIGQRELINQESGMNAARLLWQKGFLVYGWDVEWKYNAKTGNPIGSAEQVFSEIKYQITHKLTFTSNHCVLLMHEHHFRRKKEVARLIELCRSAGYKLEHLKKYPLEEEGKNSRSSSRIKL